MCNVLLLRTRLNLLPQRKQKFRNGKTDGGCHHEWGKNGNKMRWAVYGVRARDVSHYEGLITDHKGQQPCPPWSSKGTLYIRTLAELGGFWVQLHVKL